MKNRIFAFVGLLMFVCLGFFDCGCYYRHCDRNAVYAHGDCRVSCTNDYTCIHDLEAGPSFKCDIAAGYCVKKATQGAIQDGGTTVRDGGVSAAIIARICCRTGQVELWYGPTEHLNSNGNPCGDFQMSLAKFCQNGIHPGYDSGWFTYNCQAGNNWRGWTPNDVISIVNEAGSPYRFTPPFRGTVNTSGAAEVVVYGTCQQ